VGWELYEKIKGGLWYFFYRRRRIIKGGTIGYKLFTFADKNISLAIPSVIHDM
jgi:hypothetical protein